MTQRIFNGWRRLREFEPLIFIVEVIFSLFIVEVLFSPSDEYCSQKKEETALVTVIFLCWESLLNILI